MSQAGLDEILSSPPAEGTVELIARRPAEGEREVLEEATLDLAIGLVGDSWSTRGSSRTPDRSANPNAQLTLMNARAIDLVAAGDMERWALSGDQLYVDFDLTAANLPPGTRLELGSAVVEVSAESEERWTRMVDKGAAKTTFGTIGQYVGSNIPGKPKR